VHANYGARAGDTAPPGNDYYQVFSPYHRAWSEAPWGEPDPTPRAIRIPAGVEPGGATGLRGDSTRAAVRGGESAGVERAAAWLAEHLDGYGEGGHDALAADVTSRLSPYLHFGCISSRALALRARERGGEAFVRQLCWRDFYAQILFARPETQVEDMRSSSDRWLDEPDGLAAWKDGMTGYPLVDAGMRQLRAEGWMHNRARMVTASFLVKDLGIDWREGARHFFDLLLDGDVAQNVGNWQWIAGTGVDTRPNRIYNPTAQLKKLDPEGAYVRRYVPELADVPPRDIAEPGLLAPSYPSPIVDHAQAAAAFRARRGVGDDD
jgi:deoxyribodipyrimidine photo-lyase